MRTTLGATALGIGMFVGSLVATEPPPSLITVGAILLSSGYSEP